MTTTRELLTGALRLINAVGTNETPSSSDMDISLEALNALIDSKSNDLLNIHTVTPHKFALVPGQFKYTLGPGGDWDTDRPMRLEQAKLMLNPIIVLPVPVPVASFTFSPDGGYVPISISFTNTGTSENCTFLWDFGDGTTSTEENPIHEYTSATTFAVTLTTTNSTGTNTSAPAEIVMQDYFLTSTFNYNVNSMGYQQEILDWLHGHVPYLDPLNYGQGFDQGQLPAGAWTLGTNNLFKVLDWSVPNTVTGLRQMGYAEAYGYCWQFEMYQPIITGHTMFYGYFTQAAGPAFDPNTPYGGGFSTTIESDGVTSWINQYGGGGATGLPPIVQGKFVTCIYVPDGATVNFFIDGVWVGSGAAANGDGYAIIGSNP